VSRPIINFPKSLQHVRATRPCASLFSVSRLKHIRPQLSNYCLTAPSRYVQRTPKFSSWTRCHALSSMLMLMMRSPSCVCVCVCVRLCQNSSLQCCGGSMPKGGSPGAMTKQEKAVGAVPVVIQVEIHQPVRVQRYSSAASVVRSRAPVSFKPSDDQKWKTAQSAHP
jgi:hypothetical protein